MNDTDKTKEELLRELDAARARVAELEKRVAESEEHFRSLFDSMTDGFFVCEVILDERGEPCDFRYLEVNQAIERILGIKRSDMIGKRRSEIFRIPDPFIVKTFGAVALTGRSVRFERYSAELERHFEIFTYCPKPGQVAVVLTDITERKRMEELLKASEKSHRDQAARLQAILDAAPAVIWIAHDRECKLITGNRAAAILSRVPEGENMSKSGPAPDKLAHYHIVKEGVDLAPEQMPIQRVAASGKELLNYSLDFVHDDGTTYSLLGNVIPVFDSEGNPNGAIAAFMDITELKKTQEALQKKERTLAEAQRVSHVGSWEWNIKTDETQWSDELYRIFGQNPETYVPSMQRNLELVHPDDRENVQRKRYQIALEGAPVSMEYRIILPDGSVRMLHSEGIVTDVDEAGKPSRMVGMIQDITEHKKAEETLKAARDEAENEKLRLEAVMEALPIGMAIYDEHGGVVQSNSTFEYIWGGSRPGTRPPAHSIRDYAAYKAWWSDTGKPVLPEEWGAARAVQKGETVVGQFIEIRRFDGTFAFIINSAAPIRDANGRVIGAAVAIQDVTELKRIQDNLRDSEIRYRELSKSLKKTVKEQVEQLRQAESLADIGRMVSIVAHEIRNPLLNILLGADTLRKAFPKHEETAEVFDEIQHGITSLNETVEELLEYARPLRLEYTPHPIGRIVRQALDALSNNLDIIKTDVELEKEEREISVDSIMLSRAIRNIIANAVEAMPGGGSLSIRSALSGARRLSLTISDTGHGMSAKDLEKLFQPFYTTKVTGTGLGLAISKKIIEAHAGSITIKSRPNKGTTVRIVLPLGPKK